MNRDPEQLIIVSNRLPYAIEQQEGEWQVRRGSGGLVTAMAPVLQNRGGIWIGWAGTVAEQNVDPEAVLAQHSDDEGFEVKAVMLTDEEKQSFYYGFANEIIWPLFHSLDERCNFDPQYWETYQAVNRKYADRIMQCLGQKESYIWVHDYHLMLVGRELRQAGVKANIGFFLHTPFPSPDIFLKLPWRFDVLRGLLDYDLVGFQTLRDRTNFQNCVRTLLPDARVRGRGRVQKVETPKRETRIGSFPISIDTASFRKRAQGDNVAQRVAELRQEYTGRQIILGVDRLDYTKGIPYRLRAFGYALQCYPELRRKVTLVQVVVPSREEIPAYEALRVEIEEIVGEINGHFTEPGWVPIHYVFRSLEKTDLLAYYRMADVALVTPLNDGMNLVAKEYCACNVDRNGVLVLSEFAGAAAELQSGGLLINPYDIKGMADTIHQALDMDDQERKKRMSQLQRLLRRRDVFMWLDSFLDASFARKLDDFPPLERYVPKETPETTDAPKVGTGGLETSPPQYGFKAPKLIEPRTQRASLRK